MVPALTTKRRTTRARRYRALDRAGATTVEMAVVAPVFILLVFGMIEFGRAVMIKHAISDAAQAGCRHAILATTRSTGDISEAVRDHLKVATNDTSKCRISVTPGDFSEIERGAEVTVSVEANYEDLSWMAPDFLADIVLRGESTMSRE